jgi:hypothetical protein
MRAFKLPKQKVRSFAPAKLAKSLLPDNQVWCGFCHKAVEKRDLTEHNSSWRHRLARSKARRLDDLALDMWVAHRKAPLDEERARSEEVDSEIENFRLSQQQRR